MWAALVAELRATRLPDGDWRRWVADSHVIRDRSAFLVARTLFATFMDTVLLGYLVQTKQMHPLRYWFIYLTNWTLTVQCAYLTLAVYATWHAGQASAPAGAAPPYVRALLILHGIALPGSLLVTLLFWLLVVPTWPEAAQYSVNYLVHGANFAIMAADVSLVAQPFPLRLCSGLLPYGVTYITFTLVYYGAGGLNEWGQPWIYIPIYWGGGNARRAAGLCAGVLLLLVPALILGAWAAVQLREAWALAGTAGTAGTAGGGAAAAAPAGQLVALRGDGLRRGLLLSLDDVAEADEEGEDDGAELLAAASPVEQGTRNAAAAAATAATAESGRAEGWRARALAAATGAPAESEDVPLLPITRAPAVME